MTLPSRHPPLRKATRTQTDLDDKPAQGWIPSSTARRESVTRRRMTLLMSKLSKSDSSLRTDAPMNEEISRMIVPINDLVNADLGRTHRVPGRRPKTRSQSRPSSPHLPLVT
jgi:hypothetical protein